VAVPLVIFFGGLLGGVLLNICIDRLAERMGILQGEHGDFGEKRHWNHKKVQYLAVVLLNALGWVFILNCWGFTIRGLAGAFLISVGLIIAVIDIRGHLIANSMVLVLLITGAVYHWVQRTSQPRYLLLGLLFGFIIPLILAFVSRGGMGGGDVKLCTAIGLWLGFPAVLYALFISGLAGSLSGLVLIAGGKKKRKDAIPFGPFLIIGFLYVFLLY